MLHLLHVQGNAAAAAADGGDAGASASLCTAAAPVRSKLLCVLSDTKGSKRSKPTALPLPLAVTTGPSVLPPMLLLLLLRTLR
jgi:hypothetical protein